MPALPSSELVDAFSRFKKANGRQPSIREMAKLVKRAPMTVWKRLKDLERLGALKLDARGFMGANVRPKVEFREVGLIDSKDTPGRISVLTCSVCKALVSRFDTALHRLWHL